jgi:glycolate oxidase
VSKIIHNKIVPAALEFMDRLCMACVRSEMDLDIPADSNALLLIEVDGDQGLIRREAKKIQEVCLRCGATQVKSAPRKRAADRLWEARKKVSPALYSLRPDKVSEDIVVPRSRMADMVAFLERLGRKYNLPMPAYGHAGDGNIHVNILFDKKLPGEEKKVTAAVKELFQAVIEMKGTISGEHGVGLTKAPFLEMELSPSAIALMARLKKAFDPKGILNPGKIFPPML